MKRKNNNNFTVEKEDFIDFLASSTPEEINKYIVEKGKPAKPIQPIIFIKSKNDKV